MLVGIDTVMFKVPTENTDRADGCGWVINIYDPVEAGEVSVVLGWQNHTTMTLYTTNIYNILPEKYPLSSKRAGIYCSFYLFGIRENPNIPPSPTPISMLYREPLNPALPSSQTMSGIRGSSCMGTRAWASS